MSPMARAGSGPRAPAPYSTTTGCSSHLVATRAPAVGVQIAAASPHHFGVCHVEEHPAATVSQVWKAFPDVRDLRINISSALTERFEWSLSPQLETFDATWSPIRLAGALNGVAVSLPHMVHLSTLKLRLRGCYLPPGDCATLLDAIRALPSLTTLEIHPVGVEMLTYLTRPPHTMRLSRLALPVGGLLPVCPLVGAALAQLPSLTVLDSQEFVDISCIASLPALTEWRIRFAPVGDDEDTIWTDQAESDVQSSLFLEHLPKLSDLRRLAMHLPSGVNCLRTSFAGEVLFHAIHRSRFHLVELDLCDWLLEYSVLSSLLRLPALGTLEIFRHRFNKHYDEGEDDDDALRQVGTGILTGPADGMAAAVSHHPLQPTLPHLTELHVTHPRMTPAEFSSLLGLMPSLTDVRLDHSQFPSWVSCSDIGIGCVTSLPALARTLQILHVDRREYQGTELQKLFRRAE